MTKPNKSAKAATKTVIAMTAVAKPAKNQPVLRAIKGGKARRKGIAGQARLRKDTCGDAG